MKQTDPKDSMNSLETKTNTRFYQFKVSKYDFTSQLQTILKLWICLSFKRHLLNGRFKTEVPSVQVSGTRCQLSGATLRVPDTRDQIAGSMCQLSGSIVTSKCQKLSHLSGNYKLILRLNGNYKFANTFSTMVTYFL